MASGTKIANKFRNDANFARIGKGIALGVRVTRAGTGRYISNKFPIFQWIPAYLPKWLISDVIAGQSAGLLLIPQALVFATLAQVPIQQVLLASWLPGIIYTIMGTSRDISIGPTSATAILTGEFVLSLSKLGVPPLLVAAALSFCVGIWSLIFGIFNLGFIFDFVSTPMAIGFTMGISNVAITLQLPPLLGLIDIPQAFVDVLPAILKSLSKINPITVAIGASSIFVLGIPAICGRKVGSENLSTLISYVVNKDLQTPVWSTLGPTKTNIPSAIVPDLQLVQKLLTSSIFLFIAASLEHVALAKTFANEQYSINQSQELFALGTTNLINSFFGGIPVSGGDMARTSVLATSGVRSPLASLSTSATVLLSIYTLSPFLQYLPQATVAAVSVVSIIAKQPSHSTFSKYWKLSFVDFVQFFIVMSIITLVNMAEIGIGLSIFFMMGYTMARIMFSWPSVFKSSDLESSYSAVTPPWWAPDEQIPGGTQVFKLGSDCMFLNSDRIKRHVIDTAFTYNSGFETLSMSPHDRPWNFRLCKHIKDLRKRARFNHVDTYIHLLRVVILDLSATSFIDSSGIAALQSIKKTLLGYGGEDVEFRFVGLCPGVRRRFERAGWNLINPYGEISWFDTREEGNKETVKGKADLVFEHLPHAIGYEGTAGRGNASVVFEVIEPDRDKY